MKYLLIALFIAFLSTGRAPAQNFADSLGFYFHADSSEGLKKFLDKTLNELPFQDMADNDTVTSVEAFSRTVIERYYNDSLLDPTFNLHTQRQYPGRLLLMNDSIQVVFAKSLDTVEVVKDVLHKYNMRHGTNLRFDPSNSAVLIENFYYPDSLAIAKHRYRARYYRDFNVSYAVPVNQRFIGEVNSFLKDGSQSHNEKVNFLASTLRLYPTHVTDRWECDYNVYLKNVIFDVLMQNAIAQFQLRNVGAAARFARKNGEWVLTDIRTTYYLD